MYLHTPLSEDKCLASYQVIRHEVIHAFFAESGLIEYGNDEVLVDWMAKQLPKIQETVEKIIKVDYFEEG